MVRKVGYLKSVKKKNDCFFNYIYTIARLLYKTFWLNKTIKTVLSTVSIIKWSNKPHRKVIFIAFLDSLEIRFI